MASQTAELKDIYDYDKLVGKTTQSFEEISPVFQEVAQDIKQLFVPPTDWIFESFNMTQYHQDKPTSAVSYARFVYFSGDPPIRSGKLSLPQVFRFLDADLRLIYPAMTEVILHGLLTTELNYNAALSTKLPGLPRHLGPFWNYADAISKSEVAEYWDSVSCRPSFLYSPELAYQGVAEDVNRVVVTMFLRNLAANYQNENKNVAEEFNQKYAKAQEDLVRAQARLDLYSPKMLASRQDEIADFQSRLNILEPAITSPV